MTHEFSIVESLMVDLVGQLQSAEVEQVTEIHFRRGSAFSEDALRQAFDVFSRDTPLQGAELVIETVNLDHQCVCGREQVITSDDLIGHMFVCPACGMMREVDEAHDLELLEVIAV
ncbi:MAG: hydrogenase maturation nickel metallochaperone HypA [Anaerolineaceae bacterium]|nr:MAG: hydrogenase maturation nickel metallochaperone HypA [Anaerolineaceae bacterium]